MCFVTKKLTIIILYSKKFLNKVRTCWMILTMTVAPVSGISMCILMCWSFKQSINNQLVLFWKGNQSYIWAVWEISTYLKKNCNSHFFNLERLKYQFSLFSIYFFFCTLLRLLLKLSIDCVYVTNFKFMLSVIRGRFASSSCFA